MNRFDNDRGQFVLLAGVVVALALVAMLVAYLQVGYHADVASADDERTVTDGRFYLERATHESTRLIRGSYAWHERDQAVTAVRERLAPRLSTLERSRVADGVVYQTAFNKTAASAWARRNCPSGPDREFGRCEAARGVVVQKRDGRTLALAVGYDLNVTTPDSETHLTVMVEASDSDPSSGS